MKNTFGWILFLALVTAISYLGSETLAHLSLPSIKPSPVSVSTQHVLQHEDIVRIAKSVTATGTYAVLHVVDGDTIDVSISGEKVRIRMIGINAPESVDPRRPVECFGREASAHLKEILSSGMVRLELDPSQGYVDRYGRMLAYVLLPDGTFANNEQISGGYAHEYTYRSPYRYKNEFKKSEQNARAQRRGLWASSTCSA